ncbi:MAG: type VI secretion system baseplate subunit TssG [Gammaproteobacteria bacterium]|nr:type VI secretion system baseplate subunit TssG [Gammaproteobacteria bacterium]
MPPQSWRKNTAITARLSDAAYEYAFVQAIRLLERSCCMGNQLLASNNGNNPVGGFTPPQSEVVRFSVAQSLGFPAGEIESLESVTGSDDKTQWHLIINLIGLTGSMGVLPYHYTEMILHRQRLKDNNLEHFFNLFNHRTASLLYKAEVKYRLPLEYERNQLFATQAKKHSNSTNTLLSLIGMGSESLQNRLFASDESLLYYGGLFNQKIRTAGNLRQILRSYFDIPVEINQFVGQWCDMITDVRTRLAELDNPKGCNAGLGRSAILGKSGWFSQGKIQIVLGPLNRKQLKKFAPGTTSLIALNELVRLYLGMENEFEFIVRVRKKDLPDKTCMDKNNPPIMGWNTFLRSKSVTPVDKADTLDIPFSASRLQ